MYFITYFTYLNKFTYLNTFNIEVAHTGVWLIEVLLYVYIIWLYIYVYLAVGWFLIPDICIYVLYADLQPLSTSPNPRTVTDQNSSQYVQVITWGYLRNYLNTSAHVK